VGTGVAVFTGVGAGVGAEVGALVGVAAWTPVDVLEVAVGTAGRAVAVPVCVVVAVGFEVCVGAAVWLGMTSGDWARLWRAASVAAAMTAASVGSERM